MNLFPPSELDATTPSEETKVQTPELPGTPEPEVKSDAAVPAEKEEEEDDVKDAWDAEDEVKDDWDASDEEPSRGENCSCRR